MIHSTVKSNQIILFTTKCLTALNMMNETQLVNDGFDDAIQDDNTIDDNSIVLCSFICLNKKRHHHSCLIRQELNTYCNPNNRFHNIQCANPECAILFVSKNAGEGRYRPSHKTPIWHCKNAEDDCTFALCSNCYNKVKPSTTKRTRS